MTGSTSAAMSSFSRGNSMAKKKTTGKTKSGEFVFSGELGLREAGAISKELAKALAGCETLELKFTDVENVDLSFVQIICALHRSAVENGKHLECKDGWPQPFVDLVNETGLSAHVGCALHDPTDCPWMATPVGKN